MGNTLYRAVLNGEAPVVVAIVTVLILIFCIANLVVDLLYAWLDPRIRYASYGKHTQTRGRAPGRHPIEHFVAALPRTPRSSHRQCDD